MPLLGRDGATGALVVQDRTGRRFDEEDVRLLQAFADQAALALENAQRFAETERGRAEALAAALHSGRRFDSLVHGLTAIVWEADAATWQILFVSQAAERILGYALERWYTEPDFWRDHLHPEDRERFHAMRPAPPVEDHVVEYRMIAADGRVVWFSDFVHLIRHEDERVRWLHGVMVDITESKLAAEASRALGEVGRLLALSPGRAAVAQQIAEGVRHLFGARVATLLTMTSDADGTVTVAHVEGASGEPDDDGLYALQARGGQQLPGALEDVGGHEQPLLPRWPRLMRDHRRIVQRPRIDARFEQNGLAIRAPLGRRRA